LIERRKKYRSRVYRKEKLDQLGFVRFKFTIMSWEERYVQLECFKHNHKDCDVPYAHIWLVEAAVIIRETVVVEVPSGPAFEGQMAVSEGAAGRMVLGMTEETVRGMAEKIVQGASGSGNSAGRRVGLNHQQQERRIKFVTSADPVRAAAVLADLDPASTLSIAL
jgi:hypothetical protein